MLPKITIITPSFNQGKYIEKTIQSVLDQNYPNLEYIIIDGGSTDGSVNIIKKYENKLAYWVSEKDRNQTHAINKGLLKSSGEILNWLNSDDYLLPDAMLAVASAFNPENSNLGFVYGDCQFVKADGSLLEEIKFINFDRNVLRFGRNLFCQPASFFHKRVIDKIGLLNDKLPYAMDYEFWIRALEAGYQFKRIGFPLAAFRFHGESKTIGERSAQIKEYEQVMMSEVLGLKNNFASTIFMKSLCYLFRLKNVILRGLQNSQWKFRSIEIARKS